MTTWMSRLQNLFTQQSCLITESQKNLTEMKAENARLQSEIDTFRRKDISVKDANKVIEQIVNSYFAVGNDKDLKSKRI